MTHETEREREGVAEGQNRYEESDRILKTDDPGGGPQGLAANLKGRIVIAVKVDDRDAEGRVRQLIERHQPRRVGSYNQAL